VLLSAGSARGETSIYVAQQPGFSITLKAEGRHVFVTSLTATSYCRSTGGHRDEITETASASFLGPPQELDRAGPHLHYLQKVTETFYDLTEIDAEIHPGAITGAYRSESSSPVEGDGGCQTGSPEGDPRVHFEALRYVPFDNALATAPDPAAEAIYFSATRAIEIYLWVGGGSLTDVRGRALQTCIRPSRPAQRSRASFDILPPLAVSALDGSFSGHWGFRNEAISSSTRFSGMVADGAITGWLAETWKARERGRVSERCHTGRGERGLTPYRATRYLPVRAGG
jgi:hypothetical protein